MERREKETRMTQARELMTTDVVTVSPDTSTRGIARLLLDHAISAVPVVDTSGAPIGMVSEGDLIGRAEADRDARRDWWLALLAEGETLNAEFLTGLRDGEQTARDIMSAPVVTVDEAAEAADIARLLAAYRIKRVPVVRDGRIVGIVSRADILRAFAAEHTHEAVSAHHSHGQLSDAISYLDEQFLGRAPAAPDHPDHPDKKARDELGFSVADFRALVADSEHRKAEQRVDARHAAAERRRQRLRELITHHVADENWQSLLHRAREAAEHGEKEVMLIRFPSDLCSDHGRTINIADPDWPASLRGEPAELYLRWEHELRPRGFHLTARVLDFPGGVPGDIGLFLIWGE
jgi:CBS domain-containing protein